MKTWNNLGDEFSLDGGIKHIEIIFCEMFFLLRVSLKSVDKMLFNFFFDFHPDFIFILDLTNSIVFEIGSNFVKLREFGGHYDGGFLASLSDFHEGLA